MPGGDYMSGFAGIRSSKRQDLVHLMLQKISYRGSSKPLIWSGTEASFGITGFQNVDETIKPLMTPSGERVIVWDGHLINAPELQEQLSLHNLSGVTDAEIVLHFYEELGSRTFGNLEGEFAFAIMDGNRLLMARDRLGIRPLYYGFYDGALIFASEIKALSDFAVSVHEFPPGCFFVSDQGIFPYRPYQPESIRLNGAMESADRLGDLLVQATDACIPEGVSIGVWLSGGVDSSVIAALADRECDELYTFSAGVKDAPDLDYAEQVAEHIGSHHFTRNFNQEEALKVLDKVIYHLESFDAPLVRSAIGNYLVAELASEHVPFVLSGEGGDELFAGYAYQKGCASEIELTLSVQNAIAALHNTALQRVDRSAAAHGTRVGLPFLDPRVVRFALAIPSRWKIRGPQDVEKWPLRKAFADELPSEVIWRGKSKFWEGSGVTDLIASHAESEISDTSFANERQLGDGSILCSKEELLYFRIFSQHFGEKVPIEEIGRTKHI